MSARRELDVVPLLKENYKCGFEFKSHGASAGRQIVVRFLYSPRVRPVLIAHTSTEVG